MKYVFSIIMKPDTTLEAAKTLALAACSYGCESCQRNGEMAASNQYSSQRKKAWLARKWLQLASIWHSASLKKLISAKRKRRKWLSLH